MISSKKIIITIAVIVLGVIGITPYLINASHSGSQNKDMSATAMIQEYTKDKSDVKLTIGVLKEGKMNFKVFGEDSRELEPVEYES